MFKQGSKADMKMKNPFLLLLFTMLLLTSCKNETKGTIPPGENTEKQQASIPDTLIVAHPSPGELIISPDTIRGKARGTWFFEGSFAIRLLNNNGKEIAVGIAQAQEDWMTEDWVNFSAEIQFEKPASETGFLLFEKANPSGKAKFDQSLKFSVRFSK